jgi:hypothetical protein
LANDGYASTAVVDGGIAELDAISMGRKASSGAIAAVR